MCSQLTDADLTRVVGGNGWDVVDNAIAKVKPNWKDYSCPVRNNWVGYTIGSAMEVAKWTGIALAGASGKALAGIGGGVGIAQGLVGTAASSSYMANCDRHKAAGDK